MALKIHMILIGPADGAFRIAADMARGAGADVTGVGDPKAAMAVLRDHGARLAMIDVGCDIGGFIAMLKAERFALPVLACGIDASAERAVAAIRAGAADYIPLPPDRELIAAAIRQIAMLSDQPLIGSDPGFLRALDFARAMGGSHAPILIAGERGTGKESVAQTVHAAGGGGGFHTVECAGVAADVLESELFGHAAGAFPGAAAARRGAFLTARGGTLFLRDIDQLPPVLQLRVLAAIDEPGAPRFIGSSVRSLDALVGEGRFRADLVARLALATIVLPPLRERGHDLLLLADAFAARFAAEEGLPPARLSPPARALIGRYGWPGNVGELEDAMHRAVLLAGGGDLGIDAIVLADGSCIALSGVGDATGSGAPQVDGLVGRTVEEVERALILQTLEHCHGNRTSASQILGISVRTMRNKLKQFVESGIAVSPAA